MLLLPMFGTPSPTFSILSVLSSLSVSPWWISISLALAVVERLRVYSLSISFPARVDRVDLGHHREARAGGCQACSCCC